MTISVRNVDDALFKEFKIAAARRDKNVGQAMNEAMRGWLDQQEGKTIPITRMRTFDFGKGTERLSQEIDETLYG